jgi:MFS family permease
MTASGGSTPDGAAAPATLPPLLSQRSFSALWWGQLISILGERLTYLALIGLLAEHTAHFADSSSSWLLSLLANVMLAPVLLFAPFTGAWVDRSNLKHVMIVSDALRGVLVALIPVLYVTSQHTFPVYLLVFLLFTCNVVFLPAKSAITPEIVSGPQLLTANALLAGAGIASTAIGAPIGGWVVDHWGWATALYINAFTYAVSVVALMLVTYKPHAHPEGTPEISVGRYMREVGEGWSLVRSSRSVAVALMALGAVWIGGGFLHVAGNQHIQHFASVPGMERVGILITVLGLGAGIGTWWVNHRGRHLSAPLLLGAGLLLVSVGLVTFALTTRFAIFAVAAFVIGLSAAPAFVLSETLLQTGTSARQRGRVFSARDFMMRLLFLIAVTLAAWVTNAWGTRAAILASAGLVAAAGVTTALIGRRGPAASETSSGPLPAADARP